MGSIAHIKVYSATPSYVPVRALSYLVSRRAGGCGAGCFHGDGCCLAQVLSRGRLVDFGSRAFKPGADRRQTLSFQVTAAMFPSLRLLVYYILVGEGRAELVADSVWLPVTHTCVNGLQVAHTHAHAPTHTHTYLAGVTASQVP